jgi:hypothetical protein
MKFSLQACTLAGVLAALCVPAHEAFVPSSVMRSRSPGAFTTSGSVPALATTAAFLKSRPSRARTSLMAEQDFDQMKYTEAAWSTIASLTDAADYYEVTMLEAPLLLDIMLNPAKHGGAANEKAMAAKSVVEKALAQANVNSKQLRSSLETYLSSQPRVTGTSNQKTMNPSLAKVLQSAREGKAALLVSFLCVVSQVNHLARHVVDRLRVA